MTSLLKYHFWYFFNNISQIKYTFELHALYFTISLACHFILQLHYFSEGNMRQSYFYTQRFYFAIMNIRIEAVYEYLNWAPPGTNSSNINMINSRLGRRSEYYTHHCLDCDLQREVRSHYANTSTLFKYRGSDTMIPHLQLFILHIMSYCGHNLYLDCFTYLYLFCLLSLLHMFLHYIS